MKGKYFDILTAFENVNYNWNNFISFDIEF